MKENKNIMSEFVLKAKATLSVGDYSFYDNGILCLTFKNDIFLSIIEIREIAEASIKLTGGIVPVLSLVVTGQRNNISTEAFAYNIHKELKIKQVTIAEAVVIKDLATRIMANFYYKVTKRNFRVKVFDDKSDAIAWLLSNNSTN